MTTHAPSNRNLLLVLAHPALERSRANRALLKAAKVCAGVTFDDLYELYPDFMVDVDAEQKKLVDHDVIALQFPLYWYSVPSLLKEWLDLVWLHGFAYGKEGKALVGKRLFVACTTGGGAGAYRPEGSNNFTIDEFLRPLEQTAYLCGMKWMRPFVVHAAAIKDEDALKIEAARYRSRIERLIGASDLAKMEA
ncbi:NAD(P)H-dependent oxidoreductase [Caulobacter sp. CCUG 60055]|uniref:glutathione-regulated potassium-efflux system oxidoreductase KefF n=1 Tax=Alphaproteobacteria TaxID=28211 RepID=UPI001FA73DB7|nr:NAD(P)H-dependent oxidoreductase [Caulobacter sp. CCUG 60055]MBQ1543826.1 NAD(P)H-dependent oxidoreductase [Caulobacteraceae bacterium]MBQ9350025.1 NAD(P)H-dependent oxidoreductase [Phyllobacterium sp.]MCI3180712.1 oxidoreductase [Caulobacter sp. CCUG 60055]